MELPTDAGVKCEDLSRTPGTKTCETGHKELLDEQLILNKLNGDRFDTEKECEELCKSKSSCKAFRYSRSPTAPKLCTLYSAGRFGKDLPKPERWHQPEHQLDTVGICDGTGSMPPSPKLCTIEGPGAVLTTSRHPWSDDPEDGPVNNKQPVRGVATVQECASRCKRSGPCKAFEYRVKERMCRLHKGGKVEIRTRTKDKDAKDTTYAAVCSH